jgi:hypothetical protein
MSFFGKAFEIFDVVHAAILRGLFDGRQKLERKRLLCGPKRHDRGQAKI